MFEKKLFGQVQKKERPKSDKCEIVIKKGRDGTIRKSIRGNCTRQQLEALSQRHTDLDMIDEERS